MDFVWRRCNSFNYLLKENHLKNLGDFFIDPFLNELQVDFGEINFGLKLIRPLVFENHDLGLVGEAGILVVSGASDHLLYITICIN